MNPQSPKPIPPAVVVPNEAVAAVASTDEAPPPPMANSPESSSMTMMIREQDRLMPVANVSRIMRQVLPPYAKISDDAMEVIQECVSEFISFVTGEANERCHAERRKTVTSEDIVWAMDRLGFDDYVAPVAAFLQRMRDSEAGDDRGSGRGSRRGASVATLQPNGGGAHHQQVHHHPDAVCGQLIPHHGRQGVSPAAAGYAASRPVPRPLHVPASWAAPAPHLGVRYQMHGGAAFVLAGGNHHGGFHADDEESSSNDENPAA